jgi:hypothetical protein
MPEILIAALSPLGHVGPLLTVAQGLADRGDRVTVLSSADHAGRIRAAGATSHAIPAEADFDMTRFDIVRLFVQSMPHQTRVLSELMARTQFDAIIVGAGFFGILPFLLGDRRARPPVLTYTTTPLMVTSRDTAPSGMGLPPSSTTLGRVRNRAMNVLSQKVLLRQSQNAANYLLDRLNSRQLPIHSGFRAAGRPVHIADRSGIRLSTQRSAVQCALRRRGASTTVGGFPPAAVVVRTRR